MPIRELKIPWNSQPTELNVFPRDKYGDTQIFIPGFSRSLCGRFAVSQTAEGIVRNTSPYGSHWDSTTSFDTGFTIPSSGGTWDGVLYFPIDFGNTATSYNLESGSSNIRTNSTTQILMNCSGSLRISASVSLEPGYPIFFIGRSGNYLVAYKNEIFTGGGSFGNWGPTSIASGSDRGIGGMLVRFPNWANGQEEDIFRILADPYGELLEPQRIMVPINNPYYPSHSLRPIGANSHLGR